MEGWTIFVENRIREAVEQGEFDHLPGQGQPLDLSRNPFEDPLAPTFRRILRDNGATHPLIEARRALEAEIESVRVQLSRSWQGYCRYGSVPAWERAVELLRSRAAELNRHIKLNNLRAPLANFCVRTIDAEAEIRRICCAER